MNVRHSSSREHVTRAGFCVLVALILCTPATGIEAAEIELKGRVVTEKSEATWTQVGDDKSHGIGTYENQGVMFLSNGATATHFGRGAYEVRAGQARFVGYVRRTFPDGATYLTQVQGIWRPAAGGTAEYEGTFSIVSGSGRLAGAKGGGTFTGTRHSNGMGVFDVEGKATVPD